MSGINLPRIAFVLLLLNCSVPQSHAIKIPKVESRWNLGLNQGGVVNLPGKSRTDNSISQKPFADYFISVELGYRVNNRISLSFSHTRYSYTNSVYVEDKELYAHREAGYIYGQGTAFGGTYSVFYQWPVKAYYRLNDPDKKFCFRTYPLIGLAFSKSGGSQFSSYGQYEEVRGGDSVSVAYTHSYARPYTTALVFGAGLQFSYPVKRWTFSGLLEFNRTNRIWTSTKMTYYRYSQAFGTFYESNIFDSKGGCILFGFGIRYQFRKKVEQLIRKDKS